MLYKFVYALVVRHIKLVGKDQTINENSVTLKQLDKLIIFTPLFDIFKI